MKRRSSTKHTALYILGFVAAFFSLTCSDVYAETDSPELQTSKERVVTDLCSDGGKLATCAFQPAQDCPQIARELVDLCAEPSAKSLQFEPGRAFELCFWKEYRRRFPRLDEGEECIKPRGGNPLQPLPPEMERTYQSFSEYKAKAAASRTPHRNSRDGN